MSLFMRFRQRPTPQPFTVGTGQPPTGEAGQPYRRVVARVVTVLAGLLVLAALIAPNQLGRLTPGAFVRIPVEGLVGVALLLVLPSRPRRVVAVVAGVLLGLLTIMKGLDMGFFQSFARPFDVLADWGLLDDGLSFLTDSIGRLGAIAVLVAAVLLVIAALGLTTLAVLRLTSVAVRHRTATTRAIVALTAAWVVCAVFGAQLVPGVPVASSSEAAYAYDRARQVRADLKDEQVFAAKASVDEYGDLPADRLLTALRGKDVVFSFVESYGRSAIEDPQLAAQVNPTLADGTRRLAAAGFSARSAFLTSSTFGGYSWLAHSTFQSGLWIDSQQRYTNLFTSDRTTLTGSFKRAGWQTVAMEPGNSQDWSEGDFYGYDRVHDQRNLGYRGTKFSWSPMPDQYTLSAFERTEYATPNRGTLMAEVTLTSSHAPWAPIPRLVDWDDVGDGSIYNAIAKEGNSPDAVWRNSSRVRTEYARSIAYSVGSLVSWVEKYGKDNLVLVFLGDHQPLPSVTGDGASHDVPITIVTADHGVLDRIADWGWQDGLKPGPQAPVWPMDSFRDRFLTTFSPAVAQGR